MRSQLASLLYAVTRLATALGLCFGAVATALEAQDPPFAELPDDQWAAIARRVPGFAGWWLDGTTAVLMLVDTMQRDAAITAIGEELRSRPIRNIRVQKAEFDFVQLRDWKSRVPLDTVIHVTMVDADEVQNRIVVGVADSIYLAPARTRLLTLGIPDEALVLEVAPYAEFWWPRR